MKLAIRALVLSSAALAATAGFAATHARVDVPFSFTAKGHSYPAGLYDVSLDTGHSIVTLASKQEPGSQLSWTVGPTEAAGYPAVLKFDEIGANYALRSIQCADRITPNLDKAKRGVSATTSIGGQ